MIIVVVGFALGWFGIQSLGDHKRMDKIEEQNKVKIEAPVKVEKAPVVDEN